MHEEEDIMFKGMKAQRRLAFGVALTLSAGGGLLFSPSVQAAEHVKEIPSTDTEHTAGIDGTTETGGFSSDNKITVGEVGASGPTVNGDVSGGTSASDAAHNILTINSITLGNGYTVFGGKSTGGAAMGNTVNLMGGVLGGDVYGGFAAGTGAATGNTVNIGDGTNAVAAGAKTTGTIYGGSNAGDTTGNMLNVRGAYTAKNIKNFSTVNFDVPAGTAPGTTFLTLTEDADTNLDWSGVHIDADKLKAWGSGKTGQNSIALLKHNVNGADRLKLTNYSDRTLGRVGNNEYGLRADTYGSGTVKSASFIYADANQVKNADITYTYDGSNGVPTLAGGFSRYGYTVDNNRVTVISTAPGGITNIYGGNATGTAAAADEGHATNNTVTIKASVGNVALSNIYGGHTDIEGKDAKKNRIFMESGTVTGQFFGGQAEKGTAEENTVEMSGGTVTDSGIYGGIGRSAHKNTVTIKNGAGSISKIFGGYANAADGNATGNTVTVEGGAYNSSYIYGGYAYNKSGSATGNSVTVAGGTFAGGNIIGGQNSKADRTGTVSGNTVTVTGGTMSTGNVFIMGSAAGNANASAAGNTINLGAADGTFSSAANLTKAYLYGSYYYHNSASDITNDSDLIKGNTLNVNAQGVRVGGVNNFEKYNFNLTGKNVSGGTLLTTDRGFGMTVKWDNIQLNADKLKSSTGWVNGKNHFRLMHSYTANDIKIKDYAERTGADGDYEYAVSTDGTTADGIRSATNITADYNHYQNAKSVYNGEATPDGNIYGGYSNQGRTTINNELTVKALPSGNLNNVYGAMTDTATATAHSTYNTANIESTVGTTRTIGNVYGGYTKATTGDATHNTVNLRGGHITGDVYGGKADGTGVTTNNTVNIEGTGITVGGAIAGGNKTGADNVAGNTLHVRGTASAKTIEKFDIITFALNAVKAGGDTMLTLDDGDNGVSAVTTTTLDWSKLKVENGTGGTASTYESTWTLMHAGGNDKLDFGTTYDHAKELGAADGDYELTVDKNADNTKVTATGYRFRNNTEAAYTATDRNHAVVWGGRSDKSNTVENNTLTVSGGEITDGVYGGLATKGAAESTAQNNTLHLTGGTINDAFGGASYSNFDTPATRTSAGRAIGNRVVLEFASTATPAEKVHSVTGGYGATATDNTVEIKSGKVDDGVIGGAAKNGTAERNTVTVADGVIGTTVTGGYGATAVDNTVEIKAGTISGADFSNQHVAVLGGHSETDHGTASRNYVSVSGGTVSGGVIGGAAKNGTAERNTVTVADGTTITGAVAGGGSYDFNAQDNTGSGSGSYNVVHIGDNVTLNRRTLPADATHPSPYADENQNVQGGQGAVANYNSVSIGASDYDHNKYIGMNVGGGYGGTANYNMVTLNGTVVKGNVTGGESTSGDAVGNMVNLTGGYVMGKIYGGVVNATHRSLNNTLAVRGFNTKVGEIDNASVQNLHFYIPAGTTGAVRDTMLYIKKITDPGKSISGMNIGVGLAGNRPTLSVGDTVSLIKTYKNDSTADTDAVPLTTDDTLVNRTEGMQGVSLRYGFDLMKRADNELVAKVNSVALNEQTKSLVETRAASAALINSGADLLTDSSMNAAIEAASVAPRTVPGGSNDFNLWAAQGGSSLRLNSGSHVDAKGWNINLGFAKKAAAGRNTITYGPFLEYGRGTYDSYLDDGTHGDGKTSYFGGGVMAKVQSAGGTYVEGSLRAGRVKSDYNGNIAGTNTGYDNSSTYYAAHIGIGQEKELKNGNTIEGYAKYFYAHQGGNTTTLHTGETYEFDSVNSNRIRIGTRYTHKMPGSGAFYTGLAYEYEFGSEAGASYQGYSTPSPSLKGSTGILELGYRFTPKESHVSYGVNLMGMTGKRRGITGGVQITWAF